MAAKKQPEPEIVEVIAQESKPQESETLKSEPLLDLESTVTIDDALPKTDSTNANGQQTMKQTKNLKPQSGKKSLQINI